MTRISLPKLVYYDSAHLLLTMPPIDKALNVFGALANAALRPFNCEYKTGLYRNYLELSRINLFFESQQYLSLRRELVESGRERYSQEKLAITRDEAVVVVLENGLLLKDLDQSHRNDPLIVGAAVAQNGLALEYVGDELKGKQKYLKLARLALNESCYAAQFISPEQLFGPALFNDFLRSARDTLHDLLRDKEIAEGNILLREASQLKELVDRFFPQLKAHDAAKRARLYEAYLEQIEKNMEELGKLELLSTEAKREHTRFSDFIMEMTERMPIAYLSNARIAEEMVKLSGYALQYFPENIRANARVVSGAVSRDGGALYWASEKLQNCQRLMLRAIDAPDDSIDQRLLERILLQDRPFRLKALTRNNTLFAEYSDADRDDLEMVRLAVSQTPSALQHVSHRFRESAKVSLYAIRHNSNAFKYAAAQLGGTAWFSRDAFEANFHVFSQLPRETGEAYFEEYISILHELYQLGIDPFRMEGLRVTKDIIKTRKEPARLDSRPLAVVISAKHDWNGALQGNQVDKLTRRGYRVYYREVASKEEFYQALKEATQVKKAAVLVMDGHGERKEIIFNVTYQDGKRRENLFTTADAQEIVREQLSACLEDDAVWILESCRNGKRKGEGLNIANVFSRTFGRRGYAQEGSHGLPHDLLERVFSGERGKPRGKGLSIFA